ncbi:hypothetical protein RHMOL_Rhmol10G0051200 [Rhododendron molle]|uniref:Uncharacterized protein n=1 Tax=Rhododendron molle TaxID=49168 RepID=A0ACC0M035_RHOML|nr:hypothetical protein RHMOL_Rhmol10G0051200 [Rhododendron molle]
MLKYISFDSHADARAIRGGLKLGIAINLIRVSLESDAEAIVKSCPASQAPPSDIMVLVHDCLIAKNQFISVILISLNVDVIGLHIFMLEKPFLVGDPVCGLLHNCQMCRLSPLDE